VFIGVTALMTPIPTAFMNDVRHGVGMATYDDQRKEREPPPPAKPDTLGQPLPSHTPARAAEPPTGGVKRLTMPEPLAGTDGGGIMFG